MRARLAMPWSFPLLSRPQLGFRADLGVVAVAYPASAGCNTPGSDWVRRTDRCARCDPSRVRQAVPLRLSRPGTLHAPNTPVLSRPQPSPTDPTNAPYLASSACSAL